MVVSDIGMPECDGYELIRNVRSLDADLGYQVHMSKPIEPQELVATIKSITGNSDRTRR